MGEAGVNAEAHTAGAEVRLEPMAAAVDATLPSVSVIVPTSRPEQAVRTLVSLSRQRYAGSREIIVVGPPAVELAARWAIVPVSLEQDAVRRPDENPEHISGSAVHGIGHIAGRLRNLGATRAHAEILLFLDDDCAVTEQWIERNVRALQEPGVGAVGGRIQSPSAAYFARCTDFTNFGFQQMSHAVDRPIASASLGMRRAVFQAVGGFDEHLATSEDTDLCYRLRDLGYRTTYRPEIEVAHDHGRDTLGRFLSYNYLHGRAAGLTRKLQYRDRSLRFRLLSLVRFPPVFFVLLPLIACAATARVAAANLAGRPAMLGYVPGIVAGKLAYEFGVFRQLIAAQ